MTLAGKVSPSKKHWCYSNIVVSPSALELSTTGHGYCSLHLNLPMRGLTVGPYAAPKGEGPDIRFLRFTLHSSGNTLVRSGLPLSVKANDLVLLLRLLQASRDSTNAPPVPVPFHRVGGCSAPENAWLSINRDYAHLTLARALARQFRPRFRCARSNWKGVRRTRSSCYSRFPPNQRDHAVVS